jgi:hypothetical protein
MSADTTFSLLDVPLQLVAQHLPNVDIYSLDSCKGVTLVEPTQAGNLRWRGRFELVRLQWVDEVGHVVV